MRTHSSWQVPGGRHSRRFFVAHVPFDNLVRQPAVLEDSNGQTAVKAHIHATVEELLEYIVHDIVEEIVPRIIKEKVLFVESYCSDM